MTLRRTGLVVVAAGVGQRLGGAVHKALVEIDGRTLVEYALGSLLRCPGLEPVVLVGHADDHQVLARLCARMPRPVRLVDGGARRQDSVAAGVRALGDAIDVVLVHDAARPFPPIGPLPELAAAAAAHGAALLAIPVADTLKAVTAGSLRVQQTVPRDGLWAAQTPQAFRRGELLELLARAEAEGRSVTDEAALFEAAGRAVQIVEGSRLGFKVTTPGDLELARALARSLGEAAIGRGGRKVAP